MRLDRVFIAGFKNLKSVEVDFDESRLTTVIIGQNGTGKSNLIEAIADIFRFIDMNRGPPRYVYEVEYRIGNHKVRLTNRKGKSEIFADGQKLSRAAFAERQTEIFPDLVFGYYSGGSRRLEKIFDSHQRRYYDAIKVNDDPEDCRRALTERRLFYCRQIHGVFALLAFFALPDDEVTKLLREKLFITGFHSVLAHFKEPWFAKGGQAAKFTAASNLWDAKGPAGACARGLRDVAFHPLVLSGNAIDDYRDKQQVEAQFACFLRNKQALRRFAKSYADDREMFAALEAADISDLFRDLYLWVMRTTDASGDVSFSDLSDGERQLLMVLGLIRISRGKRALFLLDEPDTHLNPIWQTTYLDLIREWTGVAAETDNCHIVLTSHNPLTISALEKREVLVMTVDEKGDVAVKQPYVDPKGLGFSGVLTDVFGMPSTLDKPTQELIDERNLLARQKDLPIRKRERLDALNAELRNLGFMYEERDKLYSLFLRRLDDVELAGATPLTGDEMKQREVSTREIVEELLKKK